MYSPEVICNYLKNGDKKGLEYLFISYYKPLVLWADTFLNDMGRAEDLVQEFFMKLCNQELSTHLQPTTLKSYLYISVRNRALNQLDKHDPLHFAYELEPNDQIWEEYDEQEEEMMRRIETAMTKLGPQSRKVVELVYLKNMKYKDVATFLNISIATVKTLLVNALKTLRKECHTGKEILLYFFAKKIE